MHKMQCENCEKITGGLANMGRGAAGAEWGGGWAWGCGVGFAPPQKNF